jgi:hypothetical protein
MMQNVKRSNLCSGLPPRRPPPAACVGSGNGAAGSGGAPQGFTAGAGAGAPGMGGGSSSTRSAQDSDIQYLNSICNKKKKKRDAIFEILRAENLA